MPSPTAAHRRLPAPFLVTSFILVAALVAFIVYVSLPTQKAAPNGPTAEATSYLGHLELSDVKMQAAENFMNQQVVEIDGKISNKGQRAINRIDVTCIFRDVNGRPIYQQRVPVVQQGEFLPGQTRSFRLPFDTLPAEWNQAMPNLVIAQIKFES